MRGSLGVLRRSGARVASGHGVATVQNSEASWAWAREERSGRKGGASGHGVATAQSSKASLAWARGRNDNYDGGNDNYPSAVVETGARDERKDVARTGRSSCR